jgi:glycosyltransferase involved in cell wall biosynthesis
MPKVAIGLPVYNGADYLPNAIASILAQTFGDFELLISDNASDDATEDICRNYARLDRRIRYARQQRNMGAAANHNFVVRQTESRYFKWAAHDDLLGPRFLEVSVAALDKQPEVVLASPASDLIDELGQILPFADERGGVVDRSGVCWPVLPENNPGLTSADPATRFHAVMLNTVMCVEIFGLMRREMLLRTGLQGPFSGADKVLLAQMALLGPFWLGLEVMFHRRCHAKQFSAASSGTYRAQWFSGRGDTLLRQQIKLLLAYCRSVHASHLSLQQRLRCFLSITQRSFGRGNHVRRLTSGLVGNQ